MWFHDAFSWRADLGKWCELKCFPAFCRAFLRVGSCGSVLCRGNCPSGHADQSSGRLQVDWKHEDVLKTSWCLLQGYASIKWYILQPPWWRLQHVMFIRPQEDHPKTSPHDVCKCTWRSKMCWRRLDAFFRVMSLKLNMLKPSWWRLQHVMFIWPQEDHRRPVLIWRLQVDLKHEYVFQDVLTHWSLLCDYEIKYFKGPLDHKKTTRRTVLFQGVAGRRPFRSSDTSRHIICAL